MDSEYIITALKYIDERAEHLIEITDDYQCIIGLGGIKYALEALINEINDDEEEDVNIYKFTDYKSIDTTKVIKELKEKKIISEYGELNYSELEKEYGEEKATEINDNITRKEIYETYTVDELYKIAEGIVYDIKIDLMRKRVFTIDVEELEIVVNEIYRKQARLGGWTIC